jgi:Tfp pilus assembly protein PilZ
MSTGHQSDLRNSIRFPLHLQVTLKTPTAEYHAKTIDISAGGILFHTDSEVAVGSEVEFTIEIPGDVLGTNHPVSVKCQGRVVRLSEEASGRSVAVVIDEYHFERN